MSDDKDRDEDVISTRQYIQSLRRLQSNREATSLLDQTAKTVLRHATGYSPFAPAAAQQTAPNVAVAVPAFDGAARVADSSGAATVEQQVT